MPACYICGDPRALEEHHIQPQAYGGEKGLTVHICSNCHSLIHKAALAIVSKHQTGKQFFPVDQVERARPIVMSIVQAILADRQNPNLDNPTTLMLRVPKRLVKLLHIAKANDGYTNLQTYCTDILKNHLKGKI